jgi:hypothetical protein
MREAVARFVPDGTSVCMGTALEALIPFAAGHELIRQRRRGLTLIGPISDILFDQLVGAGCVLPTIASSEAALPRIAAAESDAQRRIAAGRRLRPHCIRAGVSSSSSRGKAADNDRSTVTSFCSLPLQEKSLGKLIFATNLERSEVFVPGAGGRIRLSFAPQFQLVKVFSPYVALGNPIERDADGASVEDRARSSAFTSSPAGSNGAVSSTWSWCRMNGRRRWSEGCWTRSRRSAASRRHGLGQFQDRRGLAQS